MQCVCHNVNILQPWSQLEQLSRTGWDKNRQSPPVFGVIHDPKVVRRGRPNPCFHMTPLLDDVITASNSALHN